MIKRKEKMSAASSILSRCFNIYTKRERLQIKVDALYSKSAVLKFRFYIFQLDVSTKKIGIKNYKSFEIKQLLIWYGLIDKIKTD